MRLGPKLRFHLCFTCLLLEMGKRGISGGFPTNLVLELCGKGLTVEEIVDVVRSKHREWARSKLKNLRMKVENIVNSRNNKEEETNGSRKRQRREDDGGQRNSDFNTSSSPSADSNVLTWGDNTQFDMTSESLRVSYSKKSSTLITPKKKDEEGGKGYDVEVKGFKDLGGLDGVLDELNRYVKLPLLCPAIVQGLGMRPLSGLLLHGPPGCGKSTLAYAIANETGVPFYMLSAPELVSGVSGMSSSCLFVFYCCL